MNSSGYDLNSLLNIKSGISSTGYDTFQVVGASNADEAVKDLNNYKLNYDPNPIVIKKIDPRGAVQYKQKVFVRYLQPPAPPEPGPLIIQERRPPQQKPLPPLIVRQRPPRAKTPPPLILREMPPTKVPAANIEEGPEMAPLGMNMNRASQYESQNANFEQSYYDPMKHMGMPTQEMSGPVNNEYYGDYQTSSNNGFGYKSYGSTEVYNPMKNEFDVYSGGNESDILRKILGNGPNTSSMTSNGWTTEVIRN